MRLGADVTTCVCVCSQRGHEHEQAEEQEASSKTSLAQGDANRSGYRLPRTRNRSGPEMEAWCEMLACYSCLFSLWRRGSDCAMERPSQYDRWC